MKKIISKTSILLGVLSLTIGFTALTATIWTSTTDVTKLSVGDGRISTTGPQKGYIYMQSIPSGGGGAFKDGNWMKADGTFDLTKKVTVDGSVSWPSTFNISLQGDKRVFTGNKLPDHVTGVYPIASSDDAYNYDRNPNSIKSQTMTISLPANPTVASKASPLPMGAIGIMKSGSVLFNAVDGQGKDAVAHEIQDQCDGHPEQTGEYHYHSMSNCIADNHGSGHSELIGYALDGFGIFGKYGENGKLLSNQDLDEYHGHSHAIPWDGKTVVMYHYHATSEYPYTIGAFKGTPVAVSGTTTCTNPPPRPGSPPPPSNQCQNGGTTNPNTNIPDTMAPSIPAGLKSTQVTKSGFKLSWTASSDNKAVVGYKLYRDGKLADVSTDSNYTFNGLTENTTYRISIRAFDAANNVSSQSAVLVVKTAMVKDTTPPNRPKYLKISKLTKSGFTVNWMASTDNVAVKSYKVYDNGKLVATVTGTNYAFGKLLANSKHLVTIKALDTSNLLSLPSVTLTVITLKR